ncbi:MAG: exo-alpha-sialidase [Microbacteriaceae bacterium]|nr:exo-alpha-sialidase [Microbacteriaceae bacterium]
MKTPKSLSLRTVVAVLTGVGFASAVTVGVIPGVLSGISPAAALGTPWSDPFDLSAPGQTSIRPLVSVNDNGNAVAVWSRFDGTANVVQTRYLLNGSTTWSAVTKISSIGAEDTDNSQVVINNNETVAVVWRSWNDGVIRSNRSIDGGQTWSGVEPLFADGGEAAWDPVLGLNDAGQAVAVWKRSNGSNDTIQTSYSTNGGLTWSSVATISATLQNAGNPQVSLNSVGQAVVVWKRNDGSNDIIQARRSTDGGQTWSGVENLSAAGHSADNPQVSLNDAGQAVAVWKRSNGSNDIIQAGYSINAGNTWSSAPDLSAGAQSAGDAQVEINSLGHTVVIWSRSDGINKIVQTRTSIDGGINWQAVQSLSDPGRDSEYPQVSMSDTDVTVAVWRRDTGSDILVHSRSSYDGGAEWAPVEQLSNDGVDSYYQDVSISNNGQTVAIWYYYNGFNDIIQTRWAIKSGGGGSGGSGGGSGSDSADSTSALATTGGNTSVSAISIGIAASLLGVAVVLRRSLRRRHVQQ